jgi:hypothetical protein
MWQVGCVRSEVRRLGLAADVDACKAGVAGGGGEYCTAFYYLCEPLEGDLLCFKTAHGPQPAFERGHMEPGASRSKLHAGQVMILTVDSNPIMNIGRFSGLESGQRHHS